MRRAARTLMACTLLLATTGTVPGGLPDETERVEANSVEPAGRPRWDGEVQVFGALRAMFHQGEIGAKVKVSDLLPDPRLFGVGALADLAGEITIVGGEVLVSYPEGEDQARTEIASGDVQATLLVTAGVDAWQGITTDREIPFEKLGEEIGRLAHAAGMSLGSRFPFLMEGNVKDLRWHVINGRKLTGGGGSHADHLASAVKGERSGSKATLIGFFSAHDQGVFTHMGSTIHIHCVLENPLSTGHVDHVVIPAGTTIRFPRGGDRLTPTKN